MRAKTRSPKSSIKKESGIAEQLMELKGITQSAGTLHDAQRAQLRMWGWLGVPHASSFEVRVALPYMTAGEKKLVEQYRVEYHVTADARPPRNLKILLQGLDRSVKWLLGDHFATRVVLNGKAIFVKDGARRKQNVKKLLERLNHDDSASSKR